MSVLDIAEGRNDAAKFGLSGEGGLVPATEARQGTIDVAFGVDNGYAPHLAAVVASIVRHAPDARIRFIVLHAGVTQERQMLIEGVAPGTLFVWIEVGEDDVPAFADRGHFNRTTLFRLGLERLAPADCRRVLYLDADLVVLDDVRVVYNLDISGASIGAVIDYPVNADEFAARWQLPPSAQAYFNAGVLLIDLERVRAGGEFEKIMRFVAEHDRDLPYNDQDALNWFYWGRWRELPPEWNAQLPMVLSWKAKDLPKPLQFHDRIPSIIHYTGPAKPWTLGFYYPWTPWVWLYWRSLRRTPFLQEVAKPAGVGLFGRARYWLRWVRYKPAHRARADEPMARGA